MWLFETRFRKVSICLKIVTLCIIVGHECIICIAILNYTVHRFCTLGSKRFISKVGTFYLYTHIEPNFIQFFTLSYFHSSL